MTAGIGVYYGWWVVRYYPGLSAGRTGLPGRTEQEKAGRKDGDGKDGHGQEEAGTGIGQARPVDETSGKKMMGSDKVAGMREEEGGPGKQLALPLPAVIEKPVFLPEVAGRLIGEVVRMIEKAKREGIVEGELIYMLQRLLAKEPNRRLRETAYEEKINALLSKELERYGSVRPDAEVVKGLWRG